MSFTVDDMIADIKAKQIEIGQAEYQARQGDGSTMAMQGWREALQWALEVAEYMKEENQ